MNKTEHSMIVIPVTQQQECWRFNSWPAKIANIPQRNCSMTGFGWMDGWMENSSI